MEELESVRDGLELLIDEECILDIKGYAKSALSTINEYIQKLESEELVELEKTVIKAIKE